MIILGFGVGFIYYFFKSNNPDKNASAATTSSVKAFCGFSRTDPVFGSGVYALSGAAYGCTVTSTNPIDMKFIFKTDPDVTTSTDFDSLDTGCTAQPSAAKLSYSCNMTLKTVQSNTPVNYTAISADGQMSFSGTFTILPTIIVTNDNLTEITYNRFFDKGNCLYPVFINEPIEDICYPQVSYQAVLNKGDVLKYGISDAPDSLRPYKGAMYECTNVSINLIIPDCSSKSANLSGDSVGERNMLIQLNNGPIIAYGRGVIAYRADKSDLSLAFKNYSLNFDYGQSTPLQFSPGLYLNKDYALGEYPPDFEAAISDASDNLQADPTSIVKCRSKMSYSVFSDQILSNYISCNSADVDTSKIGQSKRNILLRKIGTTNFYDVGDLKALTAEVDVKNIPVSVDSCLPEIDITKSVPLYNCKFKIRPGYKASRLNLQGYYEATTSTSSNNTIKISNYASQCTHTPDTELTDIVCNDIPLGNAPLWETRNILLRVNYGEYFDKGDVTLYTQPVLIPKSSITENPNPATGLKVFGTTDYSLIIKDDRLMEGGKTSVCDFRMKIVTAVNGATDTLNTNLGYNAITQSSIFPLNNGGSLIGDAQKYFRVNYNPTNGVSIKFPADKQKGTDYNIQVRCKRSDGQEFVMDQKVNFNLGAYSIATIGGR